MESYTFQDIYKPKIKTRQTSRQRISTKQIVALFVHTNQQYNKYSKNKHAEKSNMGKNSKSNEKHTWAALVAIALFSNSIVLFLPKIFRILPYLSCVLPLKSFPLSHIYISLPQRTPPQIRWRKIHFPFIFSSLL